MRRGDLFFALVCTLCLFHSLCTQGTHTPLQDDSVEALPGFKGKLPSKLFSGYIPVNTNKYIHYWFIEAENFPYSSPVVLWMQGGPGASGALGLFTELGPYKTSDESFNRQNEIPILTQNQYSWTKLANIIFFESPAGVGFSYCDPSPCAVQNDTTAADDNLEFLKGFFERYKQFANNDFYIIGESYAGIFVPMLAERVVDHPNLFNLKAVAVGDGCIGAGTRGGCGLDSMYLVANFMYGHGQFSTATYDRLMADCKAALISKEWKTQPHCRELVNTMYSEIGSFNVYNIYDECEGKNDLRRSLQEDSTEGSFPRQLEALNDYPCGEERGMNSWLNIPEVKKSLHVRDDIFWKEEHETLQGFYVHTQQDVKPIYLSLLAKQIRVLIYYGDTDARVPANGGEYWVSNLGLNVEEPWRPWTLDWRRQVAGHVVRYQDNFDFVTIRGAGHMVPEYKPRAALVMFSQWLKQHPLPTNNPFDKSMDYIVPYKIPQFIQAQRDLWQSALQNVLMQQVYEYNSNCSNATQGKNGASHHNTYQLIVDEVDKLFREMKAKEAQTFMSRITSNEFMGSDENRVHIVVTPQ